MPNMRKYIDYEPNIRAAGIIVEPSDAIGDSLKIYSDEEAAKYIIDAKCKKSQRKFHEQYPIQLPQETIHELLSPDLKKDRYAAFREKFSENMFFPKTELAKSLKTNSIPNYLTNENRYYGKLSTTEDSLYDIILPKKSQEQVNREYAEWHDKYIISHRHYFPSEREKRNYNEKFDPNKTFGIEHKVDITGKAMKRSMEQCIPSTKLNEIEKKFKARTESVLEKSLKSCDLDLNPNMTFGIITTAKGKVGAQSILENTETSSRGTELSENILYLHKLRRLLFKHRYFHIHDLKMVLQQFAEKTETTDPNVEKWITFCGIFKALKTLCIHFDAKKLKKAIEYFQIQGQTENLVNVNKFWKLLDIHYPLPKMGSLTKTLNKFDNKYTTYRLLCSNFDKDQRPAQSVVRNSKESASDCIAPGVPIHFGLSRDDFDLLRSKQDLKQIFKNVIKENFDEVWTLACSQLNADENCKMSVKDLKRAYDEFKSKEN